MKNITSRLLALLLAVMMVLSLAACGDKAPAEEAPAESAAPVEEAAPAGEAAEGEEAAVKNLSIVITHADGSVNTIEISTEAETLREALEPEGIIAGEESEYGLFVKTVDGETADDSQQQWWAVTKGGVMTETGVDGIMIADGETYEFTLTTGY